MDLSRRQTISFGGLSVFITLSALAYRDQLFIAILQNVSEERMFQKDLAAYLGGKQLCNFPHIRKRKCVYQPFFQIGGMMMNGEMYMEQCVGAAVYSINPLSSLRG